MASMLAIKVELRPSPRLIASRFLPVSVTADLDTFENLWIYIFTKILDKEAAEKCGSFIRAEVTSGEFKGTEISPTDPVSAILNMQGVSSILFLVNHSEQEKERLPRNALALLDGGSTLEPFPDWKDAGHPAYGVIYGLLKTKLGVDGVRGAMNPSHVVDFVVSLTKQLYALSTFWDNFARRNCPMPKYFVKTKGANNFYARKQKVPLGLLVVLMIQTH
jgi:hypothetical protein